MTLFITFGSWGEIAPVLEICLRIGGKFLTTSDWARRVRSYGVECHSIPGTKHEDNLDAFLRAHLLGNQQSIYEQIEAAKPSRIVSAFFCLPAHAYAEKHQIPYLATTTSPYYFLETEPVDSFPLLMAEHLELRRRIGLKDDPRPYSLSGIYPWYLHTTCMAVNVGFPELRPLRPLSSEVSEFIKQEYGVVSRGTLVDRGKSQSMVNAIRAVGLKALYLGPHDIDADCLAFLDNHSEAVKGAKVAFTHAGIGTTVDCMHVPMVVCPVGYDQFYNTNRLVELKAAVSVKDSYIRAIEAAQKPRSFLPNTFDIDLFKRLLDADSTGDGGRYSRDAA